MAFAIQCMHCMEWSFFEDDYDHVSYNSTTLQEALGNTKIRCHQPSYVCVAPFRAVIYKGTAEDLDKVSFGDSWATLIHALYKNQNEKIPGYVVLQFCNQPVIRYRHIELESLFDNTLLRYALRGLTYHMKGVVSIYAAAAYENDHDTICWLPIEPLDDDPINLIPEGFNPYCRVVRKAVFDFLQICFSYEDWHAKGCKWETRCETKYASKKPCMWDDWTHCPELLSKRQEYCACYKSDRKIIDQIRHAWTLKSKADIVSYQCEFARFHEMAVPIIVHNHLVGVIFHGQLINDEKEIRKLPKKLPFLEQQLKQLRQDLKKSEKATPSSSGFHSPEAYRRIIFDLEGLMHDSETLLKNAVVKLNPPGDSSRPYRLESNSQGKKDSLQTYATELSRAAEARYRDKRFRAESLFKKELLHSIRMVKNRHALPATIHKVLSRMADFWAFDKGLILSISKSEDAGSVIHQAKPVCHHHVPNIQPTLGELNNMLGHLQLDLPNIPKVIGLHPNTDICLDFVNQFLNKISNINLDDVDTLIRYIRTQDVIVAIIQCASFHLCFILTGRNDRQKVSPLRPNDPEKGGFSKLFENFFLDTCTDVAREYHTQAAWLLMQVSQKPDQTKPKTGKINELRDSTHDVRRKKRPAL
jgi:Sensory domain found in PocR